MGDWFIVWLILAFLAGMLTLWLWQNHVAWCEVENAKAETPAPMGPTIPLSSGAAPRFTLRRARAGELGASNLN